MIAGEKMEARRGRRRKMKTVQRRWMRNKRRRGREEGKSNSGKSRVLKDIVLFA